MADVTQNSGALKISFFTRELLALEMARHADAIFLERRYLILFSSPVAYFIAAEISSAKHMILCCLFLHEFIAPFPLFFFISYAPCLPSSCSSPRCHFAVPDRLFPELFCPSVRRIAHTESCLFVSFITSAARALRWFIALLLRLRQIVYRASGCYGYENTLLSWRWRFFFFFFPFW